MGTYNDSNEHYPLVGSLRSVFLYNQALTAAEILERCAMLL
jgi:hypothetical protein